MIYEEKVPSVRCEMNLRWSTFMREVDGPGCIFTDFIVPPLHISEDINLFAMCGMHTSVISKEGQMNT
jgi:hypothetical protein